MLQIKVPFLPMSAWLPKVVEPSKQRVLAAVFFLILYPYYLIRGVILKIDQRSAENVGCLGKVSRKPPQNFWVMNAAKNLQARVFICSCAYRWCFKSLKKTCRIYCCQGNVFSETSSKFLWEFPRAVDPMWTWCNECTLNPAGIFAVLCTVHHDSFRFKMSSNILYNLYSGIYHTSSSRASKWVPICVPPMPADYPKIHYISYYVYSEGGGLRPPPTSPLRGARVLAPDCQGPSAPSSQSLWYTYNTKYQNANLMGLQKLTPLVPTRGGGVEEGGVHHVGILGPHLVFSAHFRSRQCPQGWEYHHQLQI